MKLKQLVVVMLGLWLSGAVMAQDEILDLQAGDALALENSVDMEIPVLSDEEITVQIQQDCFAMAQDEGLEALEAGAYIESCVAEIMAVEAETELVPEDDGMMEEYVEVAAVDEYQYEEEKPLVAE